MTEHNDVLATYGGHQSYRDIHEVLSRALAEPAAQGNHAHGARAAFLLAQIAPQIQSSRIQLGLQALEELGLPEYLLAEVKAFASGLQATITCAPDLQVVGH